jgi:VWFA-related protein
MKPVRIIVPLFLLIPAQVLPQTDDFKISTNVDLVLLDVSVKDSRGGHVTNLTKDNFKIEENGIAQKITSFQNVDVPVAAGLILDASGSMRPKRNDVNTAGLAFIDASNPEDQIFILDFNDRVLPALPQDVTFTDDISLLRMGLAMHATEGRTVLYDAITAGLDHLELAERDKKTLVVVTDGGDNFSKHTLAQTMQALEKSHATVYTVGIFDEEDPDRNPSVLQRIAHVSGGQCFLLSRAEDIIPTSRKIAEDIRKRYTIGYVPDRGSTKVGLRHIRVTAAAPDGGHLVVTTRTTYADPRAHY